MTYLKSCLAAVVAVTLAAPAVAQPLRTSNGLQVTATNSDSFAVSGVAELWARDHWCSAGTYARKVLGLPSNADLYVVQAYDKGSRSVGFSASPSGTTAQSVLILGSSVREAGSTLSVGHALSYCADRFLRRTS